MKIKIIIIFLWAVATAYSANSQTTAAQFNEFLEAIHQKGNFDGQKRRDTI